jgi:hypothetical protein
MNNALVIRGRVLRGAFVSDEPVPDVEAPAELIVYAQAGPPTGGERTGKSIFDLFGKAGHLRSGQEIDAQIQDERSWGER